MTPPPRLANWLVNFLGQRARQIPIYSCKILNSDPVPAATAYRTLCPDWRDNIRYKWLRHRNYPSTPAYRTQIAPRFPGFSMVSMIPKRIFLSLKYQRGSGRPIARCLPAARRKIFQNFFVTSDGRAFVTSKELRLRLFAKESGHT